MRIGRREYFQFYKEIRQCRDPKVNILVALILSFHLDDLYPNAQFQSMLKLDVSSNQTKTDRKYSIWITRPKDKNLYHTNGVIIRIGNVDTVMELDQTMRWMKFSFE